MVKAGISKLCCHPASRHPATRPTSLVKQGDVMAGCGQLVCAGQPRQSGTNNGERSGGGLINAHPGYIPTVDGHRYMPLKMGKIRVWFDGNGSPPLREIALMRRIEWHQAIGLTGILGPQLQRASRR
jgi:hypothetical protein